MLLRTVACVASVACAASALQPHRGAARRLARRAAEESGGGQFGWRKGCCWKADSYLNSFSGAPPKDEEEPRARAMTAGGAPSAANLWHRDWVHLLDASLRACSGTALLPTPAASASHCAGLGASEELVVVSHDDGDDPVFNYATRAALDLWEMSWETFTRTPSRESAEPVERAERERLLERVARDGYVDDYCGVRVTATGRRFEIRDAYVWNVYDDGGARVGQAALFRRSDVAFLSSE